MEFFNSAVDVLQTLVIALGAVLGIWSVINLLESCGNGYQARIRNTKSKAQNAACRLQTAFRKRCHSTV